MLSQNIRNYAVAALCLILIAGLIPIGLKVYSTANRVQSISEKVDNYLTPQEIKNLANVAYVLSDSATANANNYGELAKSATHTLDNIDARSRRTFDIVNDRLTQLGPVLDRLTLLAENSANLVANSDYEINDRLLPEITKLVVGLTATSDKLGLTIGETNKAISDAAKQLNRTQDEIYKIISDPKWIDTLNQLNQTAVNVNETSKNIALGSSEIPSIGRSLERIARTSSRFTKVTLAANLIAVLVRAFF